jgi:hypothetical protein
MAIEGKVRRGLKSSWRAMGNDSNRWRSSAIGTPLRTLPRTAVDFVKQAVDASSQRCELAVDG